MFSESVGVSGMESSKMANPKIHRYYRWELLFLLFLAYFFHQADRAIFGVVTTDIQKDLGLTSMQIGLAQTAMFLTLAVMVPLAGFVGDRFNKKWIITLSILFWSLATVMTGFVGGLIGIVVIRSVATAGSESFYAPPAVSLIAAWHKKTRSIALSIHQAALYIGMITSGVVASWIAVHYGWRSTFYLFGGIGIFIGLAFIIRLRGGPEEYGLSESDSAADLNVAAVTPSVPLSPFQTILRLIRTPSVLLLTTGFVAIVFVNNAYLSWSPKFLEVKFGLSTVAAGSCAMFWHHIAALVFIMIGGVLSDVMVRRLPTFRVHLQWITMLLGAPIIFLMGKTGSLSVVCLTMFLFGAMRGLYETNTQASIFEVVEPRMRSSLVGLMVMTAFLIGSTSPLILGKLQDVYGPANGLSIGFVVLSFSWGIGGLAVLTCALLTFKKDKIVE